MDKYKINFIFDNEKDIDDIMIKVLNKELKKYIQKICKKSLWSYLPLEGGKKA
jgi:hypothetical protein